MKFYTHPVSFCLIIGQPLSTIYQITYETLFDEKIESCQHLDGVCQSDFCIKEFYYDINEGDL